KALSIQKQYGLTNDQSEKLYEYATNDGVGAQQMTVVGGLLAQNIPMKEAISKAKGTRIITIQIACPTAVITALEAKYKLTVHDIAYTWLEQNKELQVIPLRKKHDNKVVTVTRKANS